MLLIDAHVHIYDYFDLEVCFDSAYLDFLIEAEGLGAENDFGGILLLAETSRDYWFENFFDYAGGKALPNSRKTGKCSIHRTIDKCCLEIRSAL